MEELRNYNPDARRSNIPNRYNHAVELVLEDIPGGCVIDKSDFKAISTEMKEGALVGIDSNGIWHISKTAEVWKASASGDTEIRILKNHEFKAGDYFLNTAKTGTSRTINSIDDSSASHDILRLDSALGVALAAGEVIVQVSASGASGNDAVLKYSPLAISIEPVRLSSINTGCGIMVSGRVNQSLLPYPVDSVIKSLLPHVRFV